MWRTPQVDFEKIKLETSPGLTGLPYTEVDDPLVADLPSPEERQNMVSELLSDSPRGSVDDNGKGSRSEDREEGESRPPRSSWEDPADEETRVTYPSCETVLQLSENLPKLKHLDVDFVEFLTSNPEMQEMDDDCQGMWKETWELVSEENPWITMKDPSGDEDEPHCPYCTLCDKWIDVRHLLSGFCRGRVQKWCEEEEGREVGPLLQEIMDAGKLDMEKRSRRPASDSSDSEDDIEDMVKSEDHAQIAAFSQRLLAEAGPGLNFTHMCVCGLPAPGRNSTTHCCRRCELTCQAGRRLTQDPETGQSWKKPHGPECTLHRLRAYRRHARAQNPNSHMPPCYRTPTGYRGKGKGGPHYGQHYGGYRQPYGRPPPRHYGHGPPRYDPRFDHRMYDDRQMYRDYDDRPPPRYYDRDRYYDRPPPHYYDRPRYDDRQYYHGERRGRFDHDRPPDFDERPPYDDRPPREHRDYYYDQRPDDRYGGPPRHYEDRPPMHRGKGGGMHYRDNDRRRYMDDMDRGPPGGYMYPREDYGPGPGGYKGGGGYGGSYKAGGGGGGGDHMGQYPMRRDPADIAREEKAMTSDHGHPRDDD
eukprot:TRINITY_DN7897_c0_g1_i1.p1 TRINITY_DN7897_c0_g1~~TRINITY_DN7897_c0_g1_i1.p1  ORF type:complete len:606 (-),score=114.40 TRINITY_DN7897_c0_g1_i1:157-1917(-)